MRVCSVSGCPEIYPSSEGSRCRSHRALADRRRGTAHERGYTGRAHQSFRDTVLVRDPVCVLCCIRLATVADHFPHSKRELIDLGLDSNDPARGRGLCKPCHDRETAASQPGGWNADHPGSTGSR
jgi:5-methylcytosine-specific restriction enzyme A